MLLKLLLRNVGLKDIPFHFKNVNSGKGWKCDVKLMQVFVYNFRSLIWKPKINSEETVGLTTKSPIKELRVIK